MSDTYTVIGSNGFIGRALCEVLGQSGTLHRWTRDSYPAAGTKLGHVFFAAGITADFRSRPLEAARSHVGLLADVLEKYPFTSLTYLSSARLYRLASQTSEDSAFTVLPQDPEQLYDLTKLVGESLCLNTGKENVRVVRLSNVAGVNPNASDFLPSIIRDALTTKHVTLQSSPRSCKDYILLSDVVSLLPDIAKNGRERIYNLASGMTVEAGILAQRIGEICSSGYSVRENAPLVQQPAIDITCLISEFGFAPTPLMAKLENIVHGTRLALQG